MEERAGLHGLDHGLCKKGSRLRLWEEVRLPRGTLGQEVREDGLVGVVHSGQI